MNPIQPTMTEDANEAQNTGALIPANVWAEPISSDEMGTQAIAVGDYYEAIEDVKGWPILAGDLVVVKAVTSDGLVAFQRHDRGYTQKTIGFIQSYRFVPDGEERFTAELLATMNSTAEISAEVGRLQLALSQVHLSIDRSTGETVGGDGILSLVPLQNNVRDTKVAIAYVQQDMARLNELMQAKQKTLKEMMEQRMALIRAQLAPLEKLVARIREVIWTVDLYLGKDEEIILLRDGAAAPVETQIVLRQMVLAMDEECAAKADEGGIDAISLSQFDDWLIADPENVNRVIPDIKGVVALVPRWTTKSYADPWKAEKMDEANKKTYLLIRNGDKLYRIYTAFEVGPTLVPKRDEFLSYFFREEYERDANGFTNHDQKVKTPIVPGSPEYMKAEEQADAQHRHYLRMGLILQGLIDRTTVLQPLPGEIVMTSAVPYEKGWVRILTDAENILTDGREPFDQWFERVNSDLDIGMRIVGDFSVRDSHHSFRNANNFDERSSGHSRLHPHKAEYPPSLVPLVLEDKKGSGFLVRYERQEKIWRNYRDPWSDYGSGTAKTRASCLLYPSDKFFLNFDHPDVTVERMRWYLDSRVDRRAYARMFPILKVAIAGKLEEAKIEAPFRALLVGESMKAFDLDSDTAAEYVPDAVHRYKYKNKTHRPLVGDDDAKALRGCMAEIEFLVKETSNRDKRRLRREYEQVTSYVKDNASGEVLVIGHRSTNEYGAIIAANEANIFVHELVLKVSAQGVVTTAETREWRTVDKRWHRWDVFFQSERMKNWMYYADASKYFTDVEIEEFRPLVIDTIEVKRKSDFTEWQRRNPDAAKEKPYKPLEVLALTWSLEKAYFIVYYVDKHAVIPQDAYEASPRNDLSVATYLAGFHREASGRLTLHTSIGHKEACWRRQDYGSALPWEPQVYGYGRSKSREAIRPTERVYLVDETKIAVLDAEAAAYRALEVTLQGHQLLVNKAMNSLADEWKVREERAEFEKFMAEYGDANLWEGHKKTKQKGQVDSFPLNNNHGYGRYNSVNNLLVSLVERGVDIDGMTLQEAKEKYIEFGKPIAHENTYHVEFTGYDTQVPDELLDFVLVIPKDEKAEKKAS